MSGWFRNDRNAAYYRIAGHLKYERDERQASCGCRSPTADDIEAATWDQITELLANPARLLAAAAEYFAGRAADEQDRLIDVNALSPALKPLSPTVTEYLRAGWTPGR